MIELLTTRFPELGPVLAEVMFWYAVLAMLSKALLPVHEYLVAKFKESDVLDERYEARIVGAVGLVLFALGMIVDIGAILTVKGPSKSIKIGTKSTPNP